jgi:hypothetical protein
MAKQARSKKVTDSSTRRQRRAAISKRTDDVAEESQRAVQAGLMQLFTVHEIAQLGGPRRSKLYEDIQSGLLPSIKIGSLRRVTPDGYRQYLVLLAAQSQSQPSN